MVGLLGYRAFTADVGHQRATSLVRGYLRDPMARLAPAAALPVSLADGPIVLRDPASIEHPVLRLVAERTRALADGAALPDDGATLALGIEGGGMATAMTCGMAWVLERLGATAAFDRVYGVSSGSIIATHFAAQQMDGAARIFPDACTREFVNLRRVVRGKPVLSLDVLFALVARHPVERALGVLRPRLSILVAGVDDGCLHTLSEFQTLEDLMLAMRAGCAIPVLSREIVVRNGVRLADGGMIESVPLHTPLGEGVTHLLALRSRDAEYRKGSRNRLYGFAEDRVINREPGHVPDLIRGRPQRYDADSEVLACATAGEGPLAGRVLQLAPPVGTPLVSRLQLDEQRIVAAMRAGAQVALHALAEPR